MEHFIMEKKVENNFNIGGRPKLCSEFSGEEKERCLYENLRNKEIKIRLTAQEKEQLLEKYTQYLDKFNLKKHELKFNKFIINVLLEIDFSKIYNQNNISKLSYDINKIGININQIVKKINSFKDLDQYFLLTSLDKLSNYLKDIFKLLDKK